MAAGTILALGLLGLRAAMSTAQATDIDDSYLGSLAAAGIKYRSPEGAIKAGHRVCQLLAQGKTKQQVAVIVMIRNICQARVPWTRVVPGTLSAPASPHTARGTCRRCDHKASVAPGRAAIQALR